MAFCTNCGTQVTDNQRFCTVCGSPTSGVTAMPRLAPDEIVHEARVSLGLSMDPPRQSRWTVLLRGILTIPLFFVAACIGIAAGIMSLVAWFAALFTGRVPDGVQEFLEGALRVYANVLAYAYFLTPRWPGIAFSPKPSHQVTLDVDHVRLRRAAVFFRIILGYPANLVSGLLFLGAAPFSRRHVAVGDCRGSRASRTTSGTGPYSSLPDSLRGLRHLGYADAAVSRTLRRRNDGLGGPGDDCAASRPTPHARLAINNGE